MQELAVLQTALLLLELVIKERFLTPSESSVGKIPESLNK